MPILDYESNEVNPLAAWLHPNASAYLSSVQQRTGSYQLPPAVLIGHRGKGYEVSKRVLDVAVSAILLIVGLPLLIAIAVGVKLSSPGPIFFKQRRLGRGGMVFLCYKFRSMVPDAEAQLAARPDMFSEFKDNYKLKYDHRVTRFGACLRRTSLDELPSALERLAGGDEPGRAPADRGARIEQVRQRREPAAHGQARLGRDVAGERAEQHLLPRACGDGHALHRLPVAVA